MDTAIAQRVIELLTHTIEATLKIPAEKINLDDALEDIGIDSIISLELVSNLSLAFDITLSPAQLAEVSTLRELAEVIEDSLPEEDDRPADLPVADSSSSTENSTDSSTRQSMAEFQRFAKEQLGLSLDSQSLQDPSQAIEALVNENFGHLLDHYGFYQQQPLINFAPDSQPQAMQLDDIAIVGIGCRLPDADSPSQFWQNLLAGKCSVTEIPESRWQWQEHYASTPQPGKTVSRWGALIDGYDGFDADFFAISAAEAQLMDPQQRLLLQEVYNAFSDAAMPINQYAGSNTGVFVGYEYVEYEHFLRRHAGQFTQPVALSSSATSYYFANRVSYTFDFKGPSEAININCASSAVALNRGFQALRSGECDNAIVAGVCLNLYADDYVTATQYGLLSATGKSAVFDDAADGFTRGEAVVALLLTRAQDAKDQGRRIYSVIKACSQNNRGRARSLSEVKHESITELLTTTLAKAKLPADSIRYIELDGYSTRWGDAFEYEGIKNAFANVKGQGKHLALGSYKGNIGHPEPASGVVAVTKLALSLYHGVFPATIGRSTPSRFIDIDSAAHPLYFADKAIDFSQLREANNGPIRAAVNSFADSGCNVHIVLEEFVGNPVMAQPQSTAPQLLLFSAKTPAALVALLASHNSWLQQHLQTNLEQLAYTLQTGREHHSCRLAIVANDSKQLLQQLAHISQQKVVAAAPAQGVFVASEAGQADSTLVTPTIEQLQLAKVSGDWQAIAQAWVNGGEWSFSQLWHTPIPPLSLPLYPFAANRYWAELNPEAAQKEVRQQQTAPTSAAVAEQQPSQSKRLNNIPQRWYFGYPEQGIEASIEDLTAQQKAQMLLRQNIASLLDAEPQGLDGELDLIALGLESMDIAELVQQLTQLLGGHLPLTALFTYHSITLLGDYLANQFAAAFERLLVSEKPFTPSESQPTAPTSQRKLPLQVVVPIKPKGNATPIFAIAGADGSALTFQQFSRHLAPEQPLFCLEAPGRDTVNQPFGTMDETVAAYYEGIKQCRPKGPYHLLGYSNGGVSAFALAALMLSKGEPVASLTLLDSLCPSIRHYDIDAEMVALFDHLSTTLGGRSQLKVEQLRALEPQQRPAFLYQQLTAQGITMPQREFDTTYRVATASEQHCRGYKMTKLSAELPVTLYRASENDKTESEDYGWNQWLQQPLQSVDIPVGHFALVEGEAIAKVAADLSQRLAATVSKQSKARQRGTQGKARLRKSKLS